MEKEEKIPKKVEVLLCGCRKPAKKDVILACKTPGMHAWKCPDDQCEFFIWDGPWITGKSIAQVNELGEIPPLQDAATPPPSSSTPSASTSTRTL